MICIYHLPAHRGREGGEIQFTVMDASNRCIIFLGLKFCENFEDEDSDVVASFVYNKIIQQETQKCLRMMGQIYDVLMESPNF